MEAFIEIELEKYENSLKLLKSLDEETQILGLSMLDQDFSFEKDLMRILWLYKKGRPTYKLWKNYAPFITQKLEERGLMIKDDVPITHTTIFNTCYRCKISIQQIQFGFFLYAMFLEKELMHAGYTFIDKVEINIISHPISDSLKPDDNEPEF